MLGFGGVPNDPFAFLCTHESLETASRMTLRLTHFTVSLATGLAILCISAPGLAQTESTPVASVELPDAPIAQQAESSSTAGQATAQNPQATPDPQKQAEDEAKKQRDLAEERSEEHTSELQSQ